MISKAVSFRAWLANRGVAQSWESEADQESSEIQGAWSGSLRRCILGGVKEVNRIDIEYRPNNLISYVV
jgi:hypothetical protein